MVTLITMASISPPFLGGYAWRMLLGSQGVFTRLLDLDFTIVGIHGVIWVINWLIFPLNLPHDVRFIPQPSITH